jgi:hypothetical protein
MTHIHIHLPSRRAGKTKDAESSEVKELETKLQTAKAKLAEERSKSSPSGAVIGKLTVEIRKLMGQYSRLTGKQTFFDEGGTATVGIRG